MPTFSLYFLPTNSLNASTALASNKDTVQPASEMKWNRMYTIKEKKYKVAKISLYLQTHHQSFDYQTLRAPVVQD